MVSNRDLNFSIYLSMQVFKKPKNTLSMISTNHTQFDGQMELVNQITKDMPRLYVTKIFAYVQFGRSIWTFVYVCIVVLFDVYV